MFRSVVSAALTVLLLGACAKDVQTPKDASVSSSEASVTLDFQAAAGLNPGATGQAAPVRVRLYELKNTASFLRADYFALAERAPATLGPDLLDQDEVLVQPGAQQRVVRHLDPATRQWRAVIDVSPRQSSEHRISLDVQAVRTDVATPTRPAQ